MSRRPSSVSNTSLTTASSTVPHQAAEENQTIQSPQVNQAAKSAQQNQASSSSPQDQILKLLKGGFLGSQQGVIANVEYEILKDLLERNFWNQPISAYKGLEAGMGCFGREFDLPAMHSIVYDRALEEVIKNKKNFLSAITSRFDEARLLEGISWIIDPSRRVRKSDEFLRSVCERHKTSVGGSQQEAEAMHFAISAKLAIDYVKYAKLFLDQEKQLKDAEEELLGFKVLGSQIDHEKIKKEIEIECAKHKAALPGQMQKNLSSWIEQLKEIYNKKLEPYFKNNFLGVVRVEAGKLSSDYFSNDKIEIATAYYRLKYACEAAKEMLRPSIEFCNENFDGFVSELCSDKNTIENLAYLKDIISQPDAWEIPECKKERDNTAAWIISKIKNKYPSLNDDRFGQLIASMNVIVNFALHRVFRNNLVIEPLQNLSKTTAEIDAQERSDNKPQSLVSRVLKATPDKMQHALDQNHIADTEVSNGLSLSGNGSAIDDQESYAEAKRFLSIARELDGYFDDSLKLCSAADIAFLAYTLDVMEKIKPNLVEKNKQQLFVCRQKLSLAMQWHIERAFDVKNTNKGYSCYPGEYVADLLTGNCKITLEEAKKENPKSIEKLTNLSASARAANEQNNLLAHLCDSDNSLFPVHRGLQKTNGLFASILSELGITPHLFATILSKLGITPHQLHQVVGDKTVLFYFLEHVKKYQPGVPAKRHVLDAIDQYQQAVLPVDEYVRCKYRELLKKLDDDIEIILRTPVKVSEDQTKNLGQCIFEEESSQLNNEMRNVQMALLPNEILKEKIEVIKQRVKSKAINKLKSDYKEYRNIIAQLNLLERKLEEKKAILRGQKNKLEECIIEQTYNDTVSEDKCRQTAFVRNQMEDALIQYVPYTDFSLQKNMDSVLQRYVDSQKNSKSIVIQLAIPIRYDQAEGFFAPDFLRDGSKVSDEKIIADLMALNINFYNLSMAIKKIEGIPKDELLEKVATAEDLDKLVSISQCVEKQLNQLLENNKQDKDLYAALSFRKNGYVNQIGLLIEALSKKLNPDAVREGKVGVRDYQAFIGKLKLIMSDAHVDLFKKKFSTLALFWEKISRDQDQAGYIEQVVVGGKKLNGHRLSAKFDTLVSSCMAYAPSPEEKNAIKIISDLLRKGSDDSNQVSTALDLLVTNSESEITVENVKQVLKLQLQKLELSSEVLFNQQQPVRKLSFGPQTEPQKPRQRANSQTAEEVKKALIEHINSNRADDKETITNLEWLLTRDSSSSAVENIVTALENAAKNWDAKRSIYPNKKILTRLGRLRASDDTKKLDTFAADIIGRQVRSFEINNVQSFSNFTSFDDFVLRFGDEKQTFAYIAKLVLNAGCLSSEEKNNLYLKIYLDNPLFKSSPDSDDLEYDHVGVESVSNRLVRFISFALLDCVILKVKDKQVGFTELKKFFANKIESVSIILPGISVEDVKKLFFNLVANKVKEKNDSEALLLLCLSYDYDGIKLDQLADYHASYVFGKKENLKTAKDIEQYYYDCLSIIDDALDDIMVSETIAEDDINVSETFSKKFFEQLVDKMTAKRNYEPRILEFLQSIGHKVDVSRLPKKVFSMDVLSDFSLESLLDPSCDISDLIKTDESRNALKNELPKAVLKQASYTKEQLLKLYILFDKANIEAIEDKSFLSLRRLVLNKLIDSGDVDLLKKYLSYIETSQTTCENLNPFKFSSESILHDHLNQDVTQITADLYCLHWQLNRLGPNHVKGLKKLVEDKFKVKALAWWKLYLNGAGARVRFENDEFGERLFSVIGENIGGYEGQVDDERILSKLTVHTLVYLPAIIPNLVNELKYKHFHDKYKLDVYFVASQLFGFVLDSKKSSGSINLNQLVQNFIRNLKEDFGDKQKFLEEIDNTLCLELKADSNNSGLIELIRSLMSQEQSSNYFPKIARLFSVRELNLRSNGLYKKYSCIFSKNHIVDFSGLTIELDALGAFLDAHQLTTLREDVSKGCFSLEEKNAICLILSADGPNVNNIEIYKNAKKIIDGIVEKQSNANASLNKIKSLEGSDTQPADIRTIADNFFYLPVENKEYISNLMAGCLEKFNSDEISDDQVQRLFPLIKLSLPDSIEAHVNSLEELKEIKVARLCADKKFDEARNELEKLVEKTGKKRVLPVLYQLQSGRALVAQNRKDASVTEFDYKKAYESIWALEKNHIQLLGKHVSRISTILSTFFRYEKFNVDGVSLFKIVGDKISLVENADEIALKKLTYFNGRIKTDTYRKYIVAKEVLNDLTQLKSNHRYRSSSDDNKVYNSLVTKLKNISVVKPAKTWRNLWGAKDWLSNLFTKTDSNNQFNSTVFKSSASAVLNDLDTAAKEFEAKKLVKPFPAQSFTESRGPVKESVDQIIQRIESAKHIGALINEGELQYMMENLTFASQEMLNRLRACVANLLDESNFHKVGFWDAIKLLLDTPELKNEKAKLIEAAQKYLANYQENLQSQCQRNLLASSYQLLAVLDNLEGEFVNRVAEISGSRKNVNDSVFQSIQEKLIELLKNESKNVSRSQASFGSSPFSVSFMKEFDKLMLLQATNSDLQLDADLFKPFLEKEGFLELFIEIKNKYGSLTKILDDEISRLQIMKEQTELNRASASNVSHSSLHIGNNSRRSSVQSDWCEGAVSSKKAAQGSSAGIMSSISSLFGYAAFASHPATNENDKKDAKKVVLIDDAMRPAYQEAIRSHASGKLDIMDMLQANNNVHKSSFADSDSDSDDEYCNDVHSSISPTMGAV